MREQSSVGPGLKQYRLDRILKFHMQTFSYCTFQKANNKGTAENFLVYSRIQDFEADFLKKVNLEYRFRKIIMPSLIYLQFI